jgi:hypothetical protein
MTCSDPSCFPIFLSAIQSDCTSCRSVDNKRYVALSTNAPPIAEFVWTAYPPLACHTHSIASRSVSNFMGARYLIAGAQLTRLFCGPAGLSKSPATRMRSPHGHGLPTALVILPASRPRKSRMRGA